jgi:hypothetical protein
MAKCSCDTCPAAGCGATPRKKGILRRLPFSLWFFLAVAAGTLVYDVLDAEAAVYHSRESALELAFPEADSVTTRTLVLSEAEATEIAHRAGAALESRIVRVYEAWSGGDVTARGIIDTHQIRSLPETLLVVADLEHRVEAVHLLAFHEPEQYRASEKWFAQFEDRALDSEMAVRRGIAGVAGATMTSNAVTASVRRSLATLEVGFGDDPETVIGK